MCRRLLAAFLKLNALISSTIPGYRTAMDFFKPRLPLEQEFAKHKYCSAIEYGDVYQPTSR